MGRKKERKRTKLLKKMTIKKKNSKTKCDKREKINIHNFVSNFNNNIPCYYVN